MCSGVCSQAIPRPPVKRAAAIGLANGCEDVLNQVSFVVLLILRWDSWESWKFVSCYACPHTPAITHLHLNLRLRLHLLFPNVELAHLSGR